VLCLCHLFVTCSNIVSSEVTFLDNGITVNF